MIYSTDKGHSVTMHKPTDEYFGRYETGLFSSSKIHFLNLNV